MTPFLRVSSAMIFALWMISGALPANAVALRLQPHMAIYDVSLARSEDKLGLVKVAGRLVLEVTGSECNDWTVNFRMVSQFFSDDDTVRLLDTQSSTWEAGSGKELHVTQRHFVDNSLDTEARVGAMVETSGRVHGKVDKPKEQSFELAKGTIFPIAHLRRLVAAAAGGETRDKSIVFDGSEGSKAYTAITFIGHQHVAGQHSTGLKVGDASKLRAVPSWPVAISFFDPDSGAHVEGVPSYEMQFEMFENGVAGDMVIDYGDYALKANLAKLKYDKQGPCN